MLVLQRYGRLGASSRLRILDYLPSLRANGVQADVSPLLDDAYLRALYLGRARGVEIASGYWRRTAAVVRARKYDLLWIEKELFPFLPATIERFLKLIGISYVVDYDDATFHRYDAHSSRIVRSLLGRKIDAVMRNATFVIAGNQYLAERARSAGAARVEVLPTVVNLERYEIVSKGVKSDNVVVGWVGSPSTAKYLRAIRSPLAHLQREYGVRIGLIGSGPVDLPGVSLEVCDWTEEEEATQIAAFDIGIMPLPDAPWEHGKCGYKLIQYMACGLPTIASPVGANVDIVRDGETGYLAETPDDWERALRELARDESLRRRMGAAGRRRVEQHYCTAVTVSRLLAVLRSAAAN